MERPSIHQRRLAPLVWRGWVLPLLAMLALPEALVAQDSTLAVVQNRAASMPIIPPRERNAIEADLDAARDAGARQQARADQLRQELAEAKAAVDVLESEIEVIKKKKDLADKQKNDAGKKALDQQQKDKENQKRLLERYVDLVERETDLVQAQRETSSTAERVYQNELQLQSLASDLNALDPSSAPARARALELRGDLAKAENDVLQGQRDLARKKETEAQRERGVAEARMEVMKAREQARSS